MADQACEVPADPACVPALAGPWVDLKVLADLASLPILDGTLEIPAAVATVAELADVLKDQGDLMDVQVGRTATAAQIVAPTDVAAKVIVAVLMADHAVGATAGPMAHVVVIEDRTVRAAAAVTGDRRVTAAMSTKPSRTKYSGKSVQISSAGS